MNRWLLPDGVDEIVADQARVAETLRRRLLDLFESWGYELVIPPVVEFTDSLLTGMGADLDSKTIKFTDQVSGRTMGFRADMSPQTARIDARNKGEGVSRLCYAGTVMHSIPADALSSRAPSQIGAELFGVDTIEADLEVILVMLQALTLATDKSLTLDLGHVGLCRWLQQACAESELVLDDLQQLIQSKRLPELEETLVSANVDEGLRKKLLAMPHLLGGVEVLEQAKTIFRDVPQVIAAVSELQQIADRLSQQVPDTKLFFDLGEMRGSNYHTGVVFGAYLEDQSVAVRVANGGRYNEVGAAFGRARPATGFSLDLKILVQISNAEIEERYAVYAPLSDVDGFWDQVNQLRGDGVRVVLGYSEDGADGKSLGCQQELVCADGEWQLVSLN